MDWISLEWIATPEALIALAALTALEIVLGIDNIVFISILSNNLPEEQRPRARFVGLAIALIGRVLLLLSITWIMQLTQPLFTLLGEVFSGRDLILSAGGLFLIGKSTTEIHNKLEGPEDTRGKKAAAQTFMAVIAQIFIIDVVFSLDSVITAVGMADDVRIMITAIVIAIVIMMLTANAVARFIDAHPTVKMLALSFLLLIGVTLVAESLDQHIPKGYIYSAMAFSLFVEMLNLRVHHDEDEEPVHLHDTPADATEASPPSS
jgi:predicted tellurium resistance membrane protein TerC